MNPLALLSNLTVRRFTSHTLTLEKKLVMVKEESKKYNSKEPLNFQKTFMIHK